MGINVSSPEGWDGASQNRQSHLKVVKLKGFQWKEWQAAQHHCQAGNVGPGICDQIGKVLAPFPVVSGARVMQIWCVHPCRCRRARKGAQICDKWFTLISLTSYGCVLPEKSTKQRSILADCGVTSFTRPCLVKMTSPMMPRLNAVMVRNSS